MQESHLSIKTTGLHFRKPTHCVLSLYHEGEGQSQASCALLLQRPTKTTLCFTFDNPWEGAMLPFYQWADVLFWYDLGVIYVRIELHRDGDRAIVNMETRDSKIKAFFYIDNPSSDDLMYARPGAFSVQ